MNSTNMGITIKALRERKKITQSVLAEKLGVSDKAVSKWETGKGLPDITLLEPLAQILGVAASELFVGAWSENRNRQGDLRKVQFYVCPICGNVIWSAGELFVSCCGLHLPPLVAEEPDEEHRLTVERPEGDYLFTLDHEMIKTHYIPFFCYITPDEISMKRLYSEQDAAARFYFRGKGTVYYYCKRHGLYRQKL